MNLSVKDANGLTVCPICGKHYTPVLKPIPKDDKRLIQEVYPNAEPYQREQLQTGICSDACWKKGVG